MSRAAPSSSHRAPRCQPRPPPRPPPVRVRVACVRVHVCCVAVAVRWSVLRSPWLVCEGVMRGWTEKVRVCLCWPACVRLWSLALGLAWGRELRAVCVRAACVLARLLHRVSPAVLFGVPAVHSLVHTAPGVLPRSLHRPATPAAGDRARLSILPSRTPHTGGAKTSSVAMVIGVVVAGLAVLLILFILRQHRRKSALGRVRCLTRE